MNDKQRDALMSSKSANWLTPMWLFRLCEQWLGGVDLDPCAAPGSLLPAKQHYVFPETDALKMPWHGRVFMNPPYGRIIDEFIKKVVIEYGEGRVTRAALLVPARVDTRWWRRISAAPVCFLTGRVQFGNTVYNPGNSAPFPSAVVALGPHEQDERFRMIFRRYGVLYNPVSDAPLLITENLKGRDLLKAIAESYE